MDLFVIKMHNTTPCVIGSHNCRGNNDFKKIFVSHILSRVDIVLMQENWLTDSQSALLAGTDPEFLCTIISGFDCTEILSSRLYGGCAIFWRSNLKFNTTILKTDNSRACAIHTISDNIKLLLVVSTCRMGMMI
jgi:hypothetical protein